MKYHVARWHSFDGASPSPHLSFLLLHHQYSHVLKHYRHSQVKRVLFICIASSLAQQFAIKARLIQ